MNVGTDKLLWTRWRSALVMAVVALALLSPRAPLLLPRKRAWWT